MRPVLCTHNSACSEDRRVKLCSCQRSLRYSVKLSRINTISGDILYPAAVSMTHWEERSSSSWSFNKYRRRRRTAELAIKIVKDFSTRRLRVKKAPVCSLLSHSFCSRCKDAKTDKQRLLKRTYQCGACNMTILVPHSRPGMSNSSYIMGHKQLAFTLRVAVQWNFWFLVLLVVHHNI